MAARLCADRAAAGECRACRIRLPRRPARTGRPAESAGARGLRRQQPGRTQGEPATVLPALRRSPSGEPTMSNPEFKRNLWLSFSTHRLIGMPALLALTFMAVAMADFRDEVAGSLYTASIALFIFIVWLWGARNANATIVDELRDKTWDQQRMSALEPWTMTWGKLLGSTSFNWYGGLMCVVVIATSGFAAAKPDVLTTLFMLC